VLLVKVELLVRDALVPAALRALRKTLGVSTLEEPAVVVTEVVDVVEIGAEPSASVAPGSARP
jgi:hypothetical protein